MNYGRVTLTIQAGSAQLQAVPATFIDAVNRVVIRQKYASASTFQLIVNADVPKSLAKDLPIIADGTGTPGSRVKIAVTVGSKQQCLMDGVSVHQELGYTAESGAFTYSLIGEDLSAFLRLEEKSVEWPGRSCAQIAREIINKYESHGLSATIVTPTSDYAPAQNQWLYRQSASDLDYLRALGRPFGYFFAIRPGSSIDDDASGYWGPPARGGETLPALSVAMGAWTNVQSIDFNYDASASQSFQGSSRADKETTEKLDVASSDSLGLTSFAETSSFSSTLKRTIRYIEPSVVGPLATAYAEALMRETTRSAMRVKAKIDTLMYGSVITPASQIAVRGVGDTHDGLYFVEQVDHTIERGSYIQEVVMTREGVGSTVSSAS